MGGDEAVEYGIIDEVLVDARRVGGLSPPLSESTYEVAMSNDKQGKGR